MVSAKGFRLPGSRSLKFVVKVVAVPAHHRFPQSFHPPRKKHPTQARLAFGNHFNDGGCTMIFLLVLLLQLSTTQSIFVREYNNLDCSGEELSLDDWENEYEQIPGYRIVATAPSNTCERTGTLTSMKLSCAAGAIKMVVWKLTTDCGWASNTRTSGESDPVKLMADTCTTFPMQATALYYDCSDGGGRKRVALTWTMVVVSMVALMYYR